MKELQGFITIQIDKTLLEKDIIRLFNTMTILAGMNGGNRKIVEELYKVVDIALKIDDSIFSILPDVRKDVVLYKTDVKLVRPDTCIALRLRFMDAYKAFLQFRPIDNSSKFVNLLDEQGVRKPILQPKEGFMYLDKKSDLWLYLGNDYFVQNKDLSIFYKGKDLETLRSIYKSSVLRRPDVLIEEKGKWCKECD